MPPSFYLVYVNQFSGSQFQLAGFHEPVVLRPEPFPPSRMVGVERNPEAPAMGAEVPHATSRRMTVDHDGDGVGIYHRVDLTSRDRWLPWVVLTDD